MARNSGRLSLALRSVADYGATRVGDLDLLTLVPPRRREDGPAPAVEAPPSGPGPEVDLSALGALPSGMLAADLAAAVNLAARDPHSVRVIGSGRVEVFSFEGGEAER